jgi:hypothetical protein
MPDSATDLAALNAQLSALRGDLNRRFEQSSARFDELGGRIDDLTVRINTVGVTRTLSLPFTANLDGQWVGGTTSPQATLPRGSGARLVAAGRMLVSLPHLSRIAVFRASVSLLGLELGDLDFGLGDLDSPTVISLQRVGHDAGPSTPVFETVVQLVPFPQNFLDPQGFPIVGTEFVDNDRFSYSILAELFFSNPTESELLIPEAMFVVKTFQVDCIVA